MGTATATARAPGDVPEPAGVPPRADPTPSLGVVGPADAFRDAAPSSAEIAHSDVFSGPEAEKPGRRPRYSGEEPPPFPPEVQGTPARALRRRRGQGDRRGQDARRHAPADHGPRGPRGPRPEAGRGRRRRHARLRRPRPRAARRGPAGRPADRRSTPTRSSCPGPRPGSWRMGHPPGSVVVRRMNFAGLAGSSRPRSPAAPT